MEGQNALHIFHLCVSRLRRILDGDIRIQHFRHTSRGDHGTGQYDGDHGQHEEAHDDDHGVGEERGHLAHLHHALIHAVCRHPDDEDGHAVHDEHHEGAHDGHDAVGEQLRGVEIMVGLVESGLLVLLPGEGTDGHDAAEHLPGDQVDTVHQGLHDLEFGNDDGSEDAHTGEEQRYGQDDDPAHSRGGVEHHDDAAEGQDGGVEHHPQEHDDEHLDLRDVVGAAGDEGGRGELHHLRIGEGSDLPEGLGPEIPSHLGGDPGGDETDENGEHHHQHAQRQHLESHAPQIGALDLRQVQALGLVFLTHIHDGHLFFIGILHAAELFRDRSGHGGDLLSRDGPVGKTLPDLLRRGHVLRHHRGGIRSHPLDAGQALHGGSAVTVIILHGVENALGGHQRVVQGVVVDAVFQFPDPGIVRRGVGILRQRRFLIGHEQFQRRQRILTDGIHDAVGDALLLDAHIQDVAGVGGKPQITEGLADEQQEHHKDPEPVSFQKSCDVFQCPSVLLSTDDSGRSSRSRRSEKIPVRRTSSLASFSPMA